MDFLENGTVLSPKGFRGASTAAGIRYKDREDMALLVSDQPAAVAGTFTSNRVKAAPVLWDREIVNTTGSAQAVVVNAGIANACTGKEGYDLCAKTADAVEKALQIPFEMTLVASTGVIGMLPPADRLEAGVRAMAESLSGAEEAGHKAARAIMTTDTKPKEAAVSFEIGGKTVTLGGMCKGVGMIHPDMCTMLCFLTTDLAISRELLQEALSEDVKETYNMISVDGDTSTNDTCLLLANGEAKNPEITEKNEDYQRFVEALHKINTCFARKMAGDGEGATALLEVEVQGAKTHEDAKTLARSVVSSSLVKAMIYGHDPNWGRILCALGYAGVEFDPYKVELIYKSKAGEVLVVRNGVDAGYSEELAVKILSEPEVTVVCRLSEGEESATAWGCDLTYDYVKINADYRS
ncbi:MAG: bifunctional glutamate N-acetyltransferase/amino-acid acetyltransferase ArgJ [Lachnospiraceae bacterium]|nr:bifunctional glutamate N-acetyltransferase/amino-acid acetyltransferase ArgJ [Lachnospiraceae bacterium]